MSDFFEAEFAKAEESLKATEEKNAAQLRLANFGSGERLDGGAAFWLVV